MRIGIDVGYYNTELAPPCSALAGTSCNVDYRGQLSLCCNLSGFRGGNGQRDVVANLAEEDFGSAFQRLQSLARAQSERRLQALRQLKANGIAADLVTGSPCLFCLDSLGKMPWKAPSSLTGRVLPVIN